MKHQKSADRARRFVNALATETRDRPNWWVSIQTVADRLVMRGEDAIKLADECAHDGLVMHDQSQHTKAERRSTVSPTASRSGLPAEIMRSWLRRSGVVRSGLWTGIQAERILGCLKGMETR